MKKSQPELIIVTNSIYPYHLHNVSILSLPFGAMYRFRYEHQYFHFTKPLDCLKGKTGILVLRDRERATFIPLRTFLVLGVDDCNELVFLDLQFLHFVAYDGTRSEAESGSTAAAEALLSEREKYSDIIKTQIELVNRLENAPGGHLGKLILPVAPVELARICLANASVGAELAHAWSHLVNVLGGMTVYERVCFYLIATVFELTAERHASTFSTPWQAGVVLRTGKVYLIRIYQLMGNRVAPSRPGFSMRLTCMETHLSVLDSEIRIDGAYDRLSFLVSVLPQEKETSASSLVLTCDQSILDPSDPNQYSPIPPSHVGLRIQWPLWDRIKKWVVYPILFVLGAALFVRADDIQNCFAIGDIGKYLVQLIGLTLLAIGGKNWGFLTGAFKSGPPGTRP